MSRIVHNVERPSFEVSASTLPASQSASVGRLEAVRGTVQAGGDRALGAELAAGAGCMPEELAIGALTEAD
jgi:hypothetical protein